MLIHGICEILNWLLPLLSQSLNFEKIEKKKNPQNRWRYILILLFPRRLGKIKLHILNLRGKQVRFGRYEFRNPVISFLGSNIWFPKRRKFFYYLCLVHLPSCQSLSNGYDFIYKFYLGNFHSAGKICHFCLKKRFFSKVLTLKMYQTAKLSTIVPIFQSFFI